MASLSVKIITPDKAYPARKALSVQAPADKGMMMVLPGHEPMICRLGKGEVRIAFANESGEQWLIDGGTMRVGRSAVTILTSSVKAEPTRK